MWGGGMIILDGLVGGMPGLLSWMRGFYFLVVILAWAPDLNPPTKHYTDFKIVGIFNEVTGTVM